MPVAASTLTLSANKAKDYVGNEMLWRAILKAYPEILKPIWVTGSGKRTQRTYTVKSIDLAVDAAYRDQIFTRGDKE